MILATISSDPSFHRDVVAALGTRFGFESVLDLGYSDMARLQSTENAQKCLTILDFQDQARALPVARALSGRPHITTIAVGSGGERDDLLVLMQAGVRDVIPEFSTRDLIQSVKRSMAVSGEVSDSVAEICAFVPAKPGCGTTTVATHAAGIAAGLINEPMLLLDFDIRLGVTTFLLKAEGTRTIVDALHLVNRLDLDMWASLVCQVGNLHLLGSGVTDYTHAFPSDSFRLLLDFAARQYSSIAVDLPGTMEDHECEVLLRSRRIYLVVTPDIGALHVARRKSQWFRDLRLVDKVSVVLNCVERNTLSVKEIESIVQLPVRHLLPAAAKDLSRAVQRGEILDPDGVLGREISLIARDIAPPAPRVKKPHPVRRFVEYFSVSPARDRRNAY